MFKLRTALDAKKETLQTFVSSPVIEEVDTLDWCREVYYALARLDTFVDPVLMSTVGDIANILSRLALRVESEDLHVWTDFVSLLTNSMWSPTSFALFIVYCRARTTIQSLFCFLGLFFVFSVDICLIDERQNNFGKADVFLAIRPVIIVAGVEEQTEDVNPPCDNQSFCFRPLRLLHRT
jgi:hypothetical protein